MASERRHICVIGKGGQKFFVDRNEQLTDEESRAKLFRYEETTGEELARLEEHVGGEWGRWDKAALVAKTGDE